MHKLIDDSRARLNSNTPKVLANVAKLEIQSNDNGYNW